MSSYFDKLNLRPQERRLLVAVAAVVFIVLNIWLVWPHFKDWGQVKIKMKDAQKKLETYRAETNRIPEYESQVKSLVGDEKVVPPEDQAIQFLRIIQNQANQSGVVVTVNPRANTKTNEMFLELTSTISVQSGEKQLVDFLYNLGAGNSMIRVRGLNLRPETSRMSLGGNITLVASYQRNLETKPTTPAVIPTKLAERNVQPTEKRTPPVDKRTTVTNRVSTTNKVLTMPDRRPKPTDKPATSTNKR